MSCATSEDLLRDLCSALDVRSAETELRKIYLSKDPAIEGKLRNITHGGIARSLLSSFERTRCLPRLVSECGRV
jgi:hypothetical protein